VIDSGRRPATDTHPVKGPSLLTMTLATAILCSLLTSACGRGLAGQGSDSGPAGQGGGSGEAPGGIHGFFSGLHGGGGADGGAGH
jgi:hypothetical protein